MIYFKLNINLKLKRMTYEEIKSNSNIKSINYLFDVTKDSFTFSGLDNTFSVFKAINNIIYIIYSDVNNSIICINLDNNQKMCEIKNPHDNMISNFIHYLDIKNKRDLIMTISCFDNNIKIWNINNFECLCDIKKVNEGGRLLSACFLNDKGNLYIVTSNFDFEWVDNTELIKIFNFNGEIIKKINKSNEMTFYIDNFYDKKVLKIYILTCNKKYIKSYYYEENKLYHKYYDKNNEDVHNKLIISEKEDIIKLFESCYDGYLRIWNFHSNELIKKLKITEEPLKGICLWNEEYLFVGFFNKVELIELNNDINISKLSENVEDIITIKKISHYKYGQCLLTQGSNYSQIKIWEIK